MGGDPARRTHDQTCNLTNRILQRNYLGGAAPTGQQFPLIPPLREASQMTSKFHCRSYLEGIGCNLVGQTDASTLLLQIDDNAWRVLLYVLHCHFQLLRTVALQRAQHLCIPGTEIVGVVGDCTPLRIGNQCIYFLHHSETHPLVYPLPEAHKSSQAPLPHTQRARRQAHTQARASIMRPLGFLSVSLCSKGMHKTLRTLPSCKHDEFKLFVSPCPIHINKSCHL